MGKLGSSFASHSTRIVIYIVSCVYLFSNLTNVESFNPLIQLLKSGSSRNTSTKVVYINDYGAKGDGLTDDTQAFKDVWSIACSSSIRSKIVVPARKSYLVQPISFAGPCRSKVTLRISGTIVAPKDPDVWDGLDPHKWLYFHRVKHLTIEGGGIVDGMGKEWWARSCKINTTNVAASYLKVIAPATSPNTDGIHISASTRVELKNSIIRTGDDCISIVSNSSGIRIRNITCGPGHGISIGSLGKYNSWTQVRDVSVKGAFLSNTENGLRIKTWQGGSGFASRITFQDVWMKNVSNPIIIDQYYCDSPLPCPNQTLAVTVDNVSFIGIKGTSATEEAIRFSCSDSSPCESLYLEDIQLAPYSEGIVTSFCWQAKGSNSGIIYPPSCLSCGETFIDQKVSSSSLLQSI